MSDQPAFDLSDAKWYIPTWALCGAWAPVSHWAIRHAPLIRQAQHDGIEHVAPVLVAFGADPATVRTRIGKGLWRHVHRSSLKHNAQRGVLKLTTRLSFEDIMAIPVGALSEVRGRIKTHSVEVVGIAAHMATTRVEMRQATYLVHDCLRMGVAIDRKWSLRRLGEAHDKAAREWTRRSASGTPWAAPWTATVDGFTFTRLISAADYAEEGMLMRHCVASYAGDGKAGREITFRIEGKERATVSFSKSGRVEIKGRCNAPVGEECLRAARKALVLFRAQQK